MLSCLRDKWDLIRSCRRIPSRRRRIRALPTCSRYFLVGFICQLGCRLFFVIILLVIRLWTFRGLLIGLLLSFIVCRVIITRNLISFLVGLRLSCRGNGLGLRGFLGVRWRRSLCLCGMGWNLWRGGCRLFCRWGGKVEREPWNWVRKEVRSSFGVFSSEETLLKKPFVN